MKRKIVKIIFLIIVSFTFLKFKVVKAESETKIHLIFNKVSYECNEEVKLTINLENFTNLNETRVVIKCNEKKLKPILKNNAYGQLLSNSIYAETLLNEYVSGGYLRFHLIKKSLESGYYAGLKNNIGEFYFETKERIANIYEYFKEGSFEELSTGINVTLYDIFNQEISTKIIYSEKIKINWDKEKYIIKVGSAMPDYFTDIMVDNRISSEYEAIYNSDVDIKSIGTKVINVVIYDKTNGDYIFLSKPIEVIDDEAPIITGNKEIKIESDKLNTLNINEAFKVTDNYDLTPSIIIEYYDVENNNLGSFVNFLKYLENNLNGEIIIQAIDSSNNNSEKFKIKLEVIDVEPPTINEITYYEIIDTDIDNFIFESLIKVKDNYDSSPSLLYKAYYENNEVDYNDAIREGLDVIIKYYGVDKKENKTKIYICKLHIVDTTPPIVTIIQDMDVNDVDLTNIKISSLISISDNIDKSPQVIIKYYINDEEKAYYDWLKQSLRGIKSSFSYYGIDKSQNKTEEYHIKLNVYDTTLPVIKILNIKENSKYTSLEKIEYEVIDNFKEGLTYSVWLNEKKYVGTKVTDPGEYEFKIIATDEAGNSSQEVVKFRIIENNFIGCGDDLECYANNYLEVIIIVCILMAIILTIIIIKLFKWHKRKKLR